MSFTAGTILSAGGTEAFQGPGCMGSCTDCHTLTKQDAGKLLKTDKFKAEIKDVRTGPIKGLWEVELNQGDKSFIVYIDFAKKHLVEGKFTPLEEIGKSAELKKIDLKKIPLEGAVVMGNPKAEKKIIVFDDPDCPYCKKLHEEIRVILKKRKDVAFYIKMFPLPMHKDAHQKSLSIACGKSLKLLDDAFAGKKLPKPECDTKEVDNNLKLGAELGIKGTPAIIFPDGRLLPGYVDADALMGMIDNPE